MCVRVGSVCVRVVSVRVTVVSVCVRVVSVRAGVVSVCVTVSMGATRGATVSMSAFLACHQCYCGG